MSSPLTTSFVDLGNVSALRKYLADQMDQMEPYFPLRVLSVTNAFWFSCASTSDLRHIFTEYGYFSSYSTSWVEHARQYCEMITDRIDLGPNSQVFEIASNDGYLLQHFLPLGIPVTGIEPAAMLQKPRLPERMFRR